MDTLCFKCALSLQRIFNRWYEFAKNAYRHVLKQGIDVGDQQGFIEMIDKIVEYGEKLKRIQN